MVLPLVNVECASYLQLYDKIWDELIGMIRREGNQNVCVVVYCMDSTVCLSRFFEFCCALKTFKIEPLNELRICKCN